MQRQFLLQGATLAFFAVAFGAFGAHTLGERLHMEARYLETWKTGVQYQMYHALALLILANAAERFPRAAAPLLARVGSLFTAGAIVFGGSLYALALTSLSPAGPAKWLGAVAPLGGLCFLLGWAFLFIAALQKPASDQ